MLGGYLIAGSWRTIWINQARAISLFFLYSSPTISAKEKQVELGFARESSPSFPTIPFLYSNYLLLPFWPRPASVLFVLLLLCCLQPLLAGPLAALDQFWQCISPPLLVQPILRLPKGWRYSSIGKLHQRSDVSSAFIFPVLWKGKEVMYNLRGRPGVVLSASNC